MQAASLWLVLTCLHTQFVLTTSVHQKPTNSRPSIVVDVGELTVSHEDANTGQWLLSQNSYISLDIAFANDVTISNCRTNDATGSLLMQDPLFFPEEESCWDGTFTLQCKNESFTSFGKEDVAHALRHNGTAHVVGPTSDAWTLLASKLLEKHPSSNRVLSSIIFPSHSRGELIELLPACLLRFLSAEEQFVLGIVNDTANAKTIRDSGSGVLLSGAEFKVLAPDISDNVRHDFDPWRAVPSPALGPGVWLSEESLRGSFASARVIINAANATRSPPTPPDDTADIRENSSACIPLPTKFNFDGSYSLIETQLKTAVADPMQIVMGLLEGYVSGPMLPCSMDEW